MKHNRIGLDVGSTTLKVVVLDDHDNICFSTYVRHNARIRETLSVVFSELGERFGDELFGLTITGSVGLGIAERTQIPFVQEVVASTAYVRRYHPQATTLIDIGGEDDIAEGLPVLRAKGAKAWLSIMYGCNNFCTYCIVPYVRGRERSRDPEEIVREAEQLVADGYKELLLLGQNVNSYGRGTDVDFPELLRRINAIPGEFKISYMSSHPKDATHELIDTIAECEKVTRHFHLPVQSGSSRILKLMNRSYNREHYLELINYAKEHIPDVALTSDIIVGFPGETYEDFQETLSLIREVKYDSLFTFIYSPRKGTKAAEMPDPVSQEEKGRWFRELLEVQGEIGCSSYHDYIGRTMRVLCEGPGRTRDGCLTGKSIQNIIVDFDGDKSLIGSFVDVKITDALNWALIGELV